MNKLPTRKPNRLSGYDYSANGAYFITICTHNHAHLFAPVGADSISARMIDAVFNQTILEYPTVTCPKKVIMPNHLHAIVMIDRADMESAPTISQVLQAFKRHSTIAYINLVKQGILPPFDQHIWQRSYYDHIIRTSEEYQMIWQYIDTNPLKWEEDCYYYANGR